MLSCPHTHRWHLRHFISRADFPFGKIYLLQTIVETLNSACFLWMMDDFVAYCVIIFVPWCCGRLSLFFYKFLIQFEWLSWERRHLCVPFSFLVSNRTILIYWFLVSLICYHVIKILIQVLLDARRPKKLWFCSSDWFVKSRICWTLLTCIIIEFDDWLIIILVLNHTFTCFY